MSLSCLLDLPGKMIGPAQQEIIYYLFKGDCENNGQDIGPLKTI